MTSLGLGSQVLQVEIASEQRRLVMIAGVCSLLVSIPLYYNMSAFYGLNLHFTFLFMEAAREK